MNSFAPTLALTLTVQMPFHRPTQYYLTFVLACLGMPAPLPPPHSLVGQTLQTLRCACCSLLLAAFAATCCLLLLLASAAVKPQASRAPLYSTSGSTGLRLRYGRLSSQLHKPPGPHWPYSYHTGGTHVRDRGRRGRVASRASLRGQRKRTRAGLGS